MRKTLFQTAMIVAFLLGFISPAMADCNPASQICLGQDCSATKFGTTILDYGGKDIIACLKTDDASHPYIWKSTSGGGFSSFNPVLKIRKCPANVRDVWAAGPGSAGICIASCPAGKIAIGGGCFIGGWYETSSNTWYGPAAWQCSTKESDAELITSLICADSPSSPSVLQELAE